MKNAGARSVLSLLAVLVVAGCASATAPNPAAPTAAEPSAEPSAEETVVESIVLYPDEFAIVTEGEGDGGRFSFFDADARPAMEALTAAFGEEPDERTTPPNQINGGAVIYSWPGFELWDIDAEVSEPDISGIMAIATAAEVNDVAISAGDGVTVGLAAEQVVSQSYRSFADEGQSTGIALLDEMPVTTSTPPDYEPAALSVEVMVEAAAEGDAPVVTRIKAPNRNFGP